MLALSLPEADGGFGGGALDLMPVMEACGEALVVEPLLDLVVLGAVKSFHGAGSNRVFHARLHHAA